MPPARARTIPARIRLLTPRLLLLRLTARTRITPIKLIKLIKQIKLIK